MSAYIAIGGSKHGCVLRVADGSTSIRIVKTMSLLGCPVASLGSKPMVHHEEYTLRRFGLNGTTRRAQYAVLASVDDQTACRMIDAYEALDEESASELARL